MSAPKDEVKKQIEKNTVLIVDTNSPDKRQNKLIVRFSNPTPPASPHTLEKLDSDLQFALELEDPEDPNSADLVATKPPTPHPAKR